jgi:uncharacterized protein DUF4159
MRSRVIRGLMLLLALAAATHVEAQRRGFGRISQYVRKATPQDSDGAFHFCRVAFTRGRGVGGDWSVDYPRADMNLSIRLSELTKTRVSFDAQKEPNNVVVVLTDDELFQCPFIMMTEVGSAYFTDEEAERLRDYLLKGGFLWADDFWGSYAWEIWESQIRKALPSAEYPIVELPLDHPIFHEQFVVHKVPQIPSIQYWMQTGGDTSEQGADSATPTLRAIVDKHGRPMVVITHNTDLGDSFEREGDDPRYFYAFAVNGYALGINILLYSMSH